MTCRFRARGSGHGGTKPTVDALARAYGDTKSRPL
jgi:hypothetical protein